MKLFIGGFFILLFASCYMRVPFPSYQSPSNKYICRLGADPWTKDTTMENRILLSIYNSNNHLTDTVQTGALFDQKYAVGWYPGKDTIIFNSKETGAHAWRINSKGKFEALAVTAEIGRKAKVILDTKPNNE